MSLTTKSENVRAAVAWLKMYPQQPIQAAADRFQVPRTTVRDALRRSGGRGNFDVAPPKPRAMPTGDGGYTVPDAAAAAEELRSAGLDPDDFILTSANVGVNGGVSASFRPRSEVDLRPEPYRPLPEPVPPARAERSVVICGDPHAPHQDPGLHRAFCAFLSDSRPDELVVLGDVGDYATVSRHRPKGSWRVGVKEVNRAAYKLLHDYRCASEETYVTIIPGNHDDRIENYVLDHAPELADVGPAFEEELPMYDLRRLWRLDDLGINMVDGDYVTASYRLTPTLTVRHGYAAGENTPQKMLNKHGHSQVQGHSHRLRLTYKTKHDPLDTRVAVETGCLCKIEEGLGYAPEPDWQQGFVYGRIWENGDFALAPVPYVPGHGLILPDGRRFEG